MSGQGTKPGLPSGFSLKIQSPRRLSANLGDYLDERRNPSESQPQAVPEPHQTPQSFSATPPTRRCQRRVDPSDSPRLRKQINMRQETIEKFDELVAYVQSHGTQRDTKTSEVLEAMVELLHESRKYINLKTLPQRGPWGSASARKFRSEMKNAFGMAIAERYTMTIDP